MLGAGVVTLGITVLNFFLNLALVRRADPEVVLDLRFASWARARELMSFGIYVFVIAVGDYFRFNLDSVVIARFLGLVFVTPFSVAVALVGFFRALVMAVSGPLMPAFSRLDGEGKEAEMRDLLLRSTRITSLLALLLGGLLLVHGRSVLAAWVGARFVETSYPVLVALVAGYIVAMAQTPSLGVIYARGRHRTLALWTVLEGLSNLVLSVYWATKLGILGVALGTAVPMIVFKLVLQPAYALHVAGMTARDYLLGAVGRPLLVGAAFLPLCALLTPTAPILSLLSFFSIVAAQIAAFALLALTLGCNRQERQQLWGMLRGRGVGRKPIILA